jgi:hypothetical protein
MNLAGAALTAANVLTAVWAWRTTRRTARMGGGTAGARAAVGVGVIVAAVFDSVIWWLGTGLTGQLIGGCAATAAGLIAIRHLARTTAPRQEEGDRNG